MIEQNWLNKAFDWIELWIIETFNLQIRKMRKRIEKSICNNKNNNDDSNSNEKNQKKWKKLKDWVLMYLLLLLNHNLKNNEYRNMFISIMIILKINNNCKWKNMLNYILKIFIIIIIIRMLMLYQIKKEWKNKMTWLIKQDVWNRKNIEKQASNHFKLIKKIINYFMMLTNHDKNFSLMNWMLHLCMYRMKIRYDTNANNIIK